MADLTRISEVEDFYAARVAGQVAEEIQLKEIADQKRAQFYFGTSPRSVMLRASIAVICVSLFITYFPDDLNPFWPLLAFAAAVELVRIECKVDALNRLLRIQAARLDEQHETKRGEQDADDQATAAVK